MNALLVRFFALAVIAAPSIAGAAELLPAFTFPDGSAGFEFRTSGRDHESGRAGGVQSSAGPSWRPDGDGRSP